MIDSSLHALPHACGRFFQVFTTISTMSSLPASFGRVLLASQNWVELEIDEGFDFRLEHCHELERLVGPELRAPYVVLGHCRSPHTMDIDAMARAIALPGCTASAVALYPTGNRELCAALETMAQVQGAEFKVHLDVDAARDWLEARLRTARRGLNRPPELEREAD